ncbi:hypothetical protein ACJJTC_005663 [Scirpophaga incertulas]
MDLGPLTLLQGNINHSAAAQDLLCATAVEWRAGLAIVAEPYYVPPQSDNWLQSTDGTAAIVRVGAGSSPSLVLRERGKGFVAAGWGGIVVISTYFSPNRARAAFQVFLAEMEGAGPQGNRGPAVSAAFPRWALTKLRPEVAEEAAMVRAWSDPPAHIAGDVDGMAELFADDMGVVCQAAMPRTRACPDRGQVYWWTQEVADLRATSMRARRAYVRCRRRAVTTPDEEQALRQVYAAAKKALRDGIRRAKEESREAFIATLDDDPWGRPYRVVRGKFKSSAPSTSAMDRGLLDRVIGTLFPDPGPFEPPRMAPSEAPPEAAAAVVPPVSDEEFDMVRDRLRRKKKAPGPDGVPSRVLALALGHLEERFRAVLNLMLLYTFSF